MGPQQQPTWHDSFLPSVKRAMKDYGLLAALVIIVAFFQIATNGSFFSL